MHYNIIQPPSTLRFRALSKQQLKAYFEGFQAVLPQRIEKLTTAVRQSPAFTSWQPDLTPSSLELLGDWFASHVETRPRNHEVLEDIALRSAYPIEISDKELTNRTFSLAMDVGMYLSATFLNNHSGIQWDQPFGSKKFVDYGQPVLANFGGISLNPIRILVTLAYAIANQERTGSRLKELYDIWSKLLSS